MTNISSEYSFKNYDFRKLGNFKKIPELLEFDGEYPAGHPKAKFWRFLVKKHRKAYFA